MSNRKEAAKANAQASVSGDMVRATAPYKEDIKDDVEIKADDVLIPNPDVTVKDDEESDTEDTKGDVLIPNPNISGKDDKKKDKTPPPDKIDDKKEAPAGERSPQQNIVLVSLKHPQGIVFTTPDNRKVLINGNAAHLKGLKKGALPTGGFGLTTVSKADWEYIKKTYGGMNVFKNGLIFAQNDYASTMDMQKDNDEIKSGMEPVSVGAESPVEALKKVGKAPKDN